MKLSLKISMLIRLIVTVILAIAVGMLLGQMIILGIQKAALIIFMIDLFLLVWNCRIIVLFAKVTDELIEILEEEE